MKTQAEIEVFEQTMYERCETARAEALHTVLKKKKLTRLQQEQRVAVEASLATLEAVLGLSSEHTRSDNQVAAFLGLSPVEEDTDEVTTD